MPDPSKIDSLARFNVLNSHSNLRSFLGLAEYTAHKFIPNFLHLTKDLYELQTSENFDWERKHQIAFELVQKEVQNIKLLKFFSPFCEDTVVKCDASGVGLGCVLLQNGKPIMFASRKLTSVESRYSQIEKEFLALLFACQRFRGFLLGMGFRLKTDNKPIVSFF